jgi:hypothetical protein
LHVQSPAYTDYGTGNFSIESQQEDSLVVEELRIIKPRDARFIQDLPARPWKLVTSIPIKVRLSNGQSAEKSFFISPKKVPGSSFVFECAVRTFGQRERVRRFKIKRLATG